MSVITIKSDLATLVLNGEVCNDFAAGDYLTLEFANPLTTHTNGAGGAVSIAKSISHDVCTATIRVLRNSDYDVFLNNIRNSPEITMINGSVKESFLKDETDMVENWILSNGTITDQPSFTRNNEEPEAITEYTVMFRSATRAM